MLTKIFRKVRDRLKKGVRDVGSFAGDNPELLLTLAGLGLGSGMVPGGQKFGLETLFGNLGKAGKFLMGNPAASYGRGEQAFGGEGRTSPEGFLSKLFGGGGGGITDLIIPMFNSLLAKKAYEDEAEEIRREKEKQRQKLEFVSDKYGSLVGGSPFVEDRFEIYEPWQYDSEGRIIETSAKGGIAQLQMGGTGRMGGMPFNPNNRISGILPVQRATGGVMDEMFSEQIFDPRMSGKQMMDEIKENPGITSFFPPQMGMINGPGGPKDDKIPAMLSDGEFVMTAKAVENAGGPRAMYKMMNRLDPQSSKGRGIV